MFLFVIMMLCDMMMLSCCVSWMIVVSCGIVIGVLIVLLVWVLSVISVGLVDCNILLSEMIVWVIGSLGVGLCVVIDGLNVLVCVLLYENFCVV